ncbi:MFS monocarboxylate transporter [Pseudohyphozyma bogoriensis]|nr:MFS monocarboxylate transporter [Pseudohyphozyma bogoriensis]
MSSTAPLTAPALKDLDLEAGRPITLEGDTPCPSPPESDCDAATQVGSSSSTPSLKGKEVDVEDALPLPAPLPQAAPADFPDGGLRAWLVVVGAMLVLFSTFGFSNSFGVFLQYYKTHQLSEYPTSTITWIGSTHLFIVFSSALIAGNLFDKGYFQYQLGLGSCLWVFGLFMLSLSKEYYQIFLSHTVCLGLALGMMFGPSLSCVGTYFRRLRGITLGFAAAGAAGGAIVYPILVDALFPSQGFEGTIRVCAYLSIGCLAIANCIMRPRARPAGGPRPSKPFLPLLRSFAREPAFMLVGFGVFGGILGLFIIMFFVSTFTKAHTDNAVLAEHSLSILNASAVFGRLFVGTVGDRIGTFNAAIPCGFVMGIFIFVMLGATSTGGAVVFLVIFGVSSGGYISITAALFMSLANDVSEIGKRAGVGFFFMAVAALIGSPIAGFILSAANEQYWTACTFGGGCTIVGTGLLVIARHIQSKKKGTQKI